ncbi:YbaK/EbsC family protein [Kitasatospora sp. NPDC048365]|uniref:YbaK/EbsC family protein n=1 Tax=Kitasatospora sp. NPDC048365 TaxID=3364050 RepID=UPI00371B67F8
MAEATALLTRPAEAAPPAEDLLLDLLAGAPHRVIDHPAEGRTDLASALRGHPLGQAAKCIVTRVKLPGRAVRYGLAVVRGDHRVDLGAVGRILGGTKAGFADAGTAERLTGCVSGTVVPFSFHPELRLLADPGLLDQEEIYFNAARLDRSIALPTAAYRRLADPRVEPIAEAI